MMKSNILNVIKNRRARRKYLDKSISKKILDKIIEAGIWGPSLLKFQPWKFVVIVNKSVKKEICHILIKKSKRLYAGYNTSLELTVNTIANAPVVILIYTTGIVKKMMSKFGYLYHKCGTMAEIEATSAAIQNMILVAEEFKIGTNWIAFPIFCNKAINKVVANEGELIAVLTLGYPAEEGRRADRKPLSEMVRYI